MTKLKCSVMNCFYNEDRLCSKGDIMVDGNGAKSPEGTCCTSFKERKDGSVRNSVGHAGQNIDVDCKACNCVHNKDCKCKADSIGISGSGACDCRETACSTFCCK